MPAQPTVIPGFPSSNRVPGAYGQVVPGAGGQSAANLPKKMFVVALKTTGSITPDTQVMPVLQPSDADTLAGPGSEGACALYDAIKVAAALGIPLYYASPTPPSGAVAATAFVRFAGTASAFGQVAVRIGGQFVSQSIAAGDTATVAAANLANAVNGFASGRLPIGASAGTSYCTLTCKTPGVRGMQHVTFLDVSQIPPGITATLYVSWATSQTYAVGDCVIPKTAPAGQYFKCTTAGPGSTTTEPTWPTTVGTTVTDGTAVWTCWGSTATGSIPTTAVFLGNGSGLETYANLLLAIQQQFFDRIALACNDATSIAAWKAQVDQYAGAPYNLLEMVVIASNGTYAAALALEQTVLNDTRFQWAWHQNSEAHPSRIAAALCGYRTQSEQANPNAGYDDLILATIPAQSQPSDVPSLPVLIAAINNGITPVYTKNADGLARVCRSITTKSLTNGAADYSTIDTGMQSTPDFILTDGKLYWTSVIQPNNPVVRDDPTNPSEKVPLGVFTPSRATAAYTSKLVQYSKGILSGSPTGGSATIPPIILPPQPGDVDSAYDSVAQRIMTEETVHVMPLNHQFGMTVIQAAS